MLSVSQTLYSLADYAISTLCQQDFNHLAQEIHVKKAYVLILKRGENKTQFIVYEGVFESLSDKLKGVTRGLRAS